ncbi:hypothetical protein BJ878DRAFT_277753 [Calycina marina]|uniref:Uncharacterized protein n=1 Tax=Calycina marina TaxID=1763456 RepID=A0A9P8CH40_9HELO|nr:hypothetical protein BJ878DRAFT_277753 [Calycina marina]
MHTSPHPLPGAFSFAYLPSPKETIPPRLSGAKSHIFQPPRPRTPSTSASSSLLLTHSATSAMSTNYQHVQPTGRKRSRVDYNNGRNSPEPKHAQVPGSPQPFVNTRYLLKGGMDTPSLKAAHMYESRTDYLDAGFRRDCGLEAEEPNSMYESFLPPQLDREANGRGRPSSMRPALSSGGGWSKAAFEVVGGVVGKVWEFCKQGAFKGFHSGADKGYSITDANGFVEESESWATAKIMTNWGDERVSTPVPGQFPEDDFIPDYWDQPDDTSQRPGKRRQISGNNDEIARNWVVVQPPASERPSTPTRLSKVSASPARYGMPTASSASRRARPVASRAGPLPSNSSSRPLLSRVSHAGNTSLRSSQPASFASPRSPCGSKIPRATGSPIRNGNGRDSPSRLNSPAAREAQRRAIQNKREEAEADITMRRMDKKLKDLIRQGKEALGTKIEVEIEDDYKPVISRPKIKKWGI